MIEVVQDYATVLLSSTNLQFDATSLLDVNPWTDDTTTAMAAATKSKSEMRYMDIELTKS